MHYAYNITEGNPLKNRQRSTRMAVFYNQANLSYNGGNTNSNIVAGEILEVLSMNKTAINPTYGAGDTVTYAVNIINSGTTPITGLTLTDNLGEYTVGTATVVPLSYVDGTVTYYQNGVLQPDPTISATSPLTITGITVPAGGNTTIIYSATANEGAPLAQGSTIVNTAVITGDSVTVPLSAQGTVTVETEPVLTISKGINPTTVTENSPITYTFTIQNLGNREAVSTDNVVITDSFNPILENITVTINGTPAVEGTDYTYDTATGLFTTVAGVITVPEATYTQNPTTGEWTVTPGTSVVVVNGTV